MSPSSAALNILIVDDDVVDREMIRRCLDRGHLNVKMTEASTVDDGLRLYDQEKFDAILLDYRMPQRDGIEMILELRTYMRDFGSAIIMMSSADDEELAEQCLNAGAQDFIPKAEITSGRISRALIHARTRFSLEHKLRKSFLKTKELAEKDSLTNLSNRFVFEEALKVSIANNQRHEFKLALILFDVDKFKQINDVHGHDIGDLVLIGVAERVAKSLRSDELFVRLGGDEFAIMINNLRDVFQLSRISKRLLSCFKAPIVIGDLHIDVSISIGIAIHPDNCTDSKELVKCSDIALYRAKIDRGNKVCFFLPEMQEQFLRRYRVEKMVNHALKNEGFELHYQPIINPQDLSLVGFEALLRLNSPNSDKTYPDEFIPIAESNGSIIPIGDWVIDQAISQCAQWNSQYRKTYSMAINLSAIQIENSEVHKVVANALKKHGVAAQLIEFEITETALLNAQTDIVDRIKRIRELGCGIGLDDFGTGYSSISHLHNFPITTVKFDRSIIPHAPDDKHSTRIIKALLAMVNVLELEVVAEGIEEEFQAGIIKAFNISKAQGYYFQRPSGAQEIELAYFSEAKKIGRN